MTAEKRTIENLRKSYGGRIYVFLKSEQVCREFFADAYLEGYRFGENKPAESPLTDIVALEDNGKLCYVGFAGHMAFRLPKGVKGEFYRVDYEKYKRGDEDFIISD